MRRLEVAKGVSLPEAAWNGRSREILSEPVIALLADLHRELNPERLRLLGEREERQRRYDAGEVPDYLDRSSPAVTSDWKVAPIPRDLLCRRVEITGPVNSAKMVINMLSRSADGARADCAMLDFEDALKPSWPNVIEGAHNVIGAVNGTLRHSEGGKIYSLDAGDMALVMVRCRGLHLRESNFAVDDEPISAGLFDLAVSCFHNAQAYLQQGLTPKYYVPKCEHYLEARWWNTLFSRIEDALSLARSTLRATFLIETLPAAFQIEEILYEIREHAVGLNVGRWDKIFSDIKTLRAHKDRVLADRGYIDMHRPWMANYALRLIEICHRRGAFAMGGMAAFTPGKDPVLREQQTARVRADKAHEASIGHDGCWVSHPYFISSAMAEFRRDNQLDRLTGLRDKYPDLLPQAEGPRTEAGLRKNVRVGIAYMHGWIHDVGCVAWDNLMEDLATLEISRAQVWQWLHHGIRLDDGAQLGGDLVRKVFAEELARIVAELGPDEHAAQKWLQACRQAQELFLQREMPPFLSLQSEIAR